MKGRKIYLPGIITLVVILFLAGYLILENYRALSARTGELEASVAGLEKKVTDLKVAINEMNRRLDLTGADQDGKLFEYEGLVNVTDLDPAIVVDMRYASEDNFTGQRLYSMAICLLQRGTAEKLASANAEFMGKGYRLKVWDAYRPLGVQEKLWEVVSDSRYVAHPDQGSNHNRGAAVDVTLVDEDGEELVMPTGFDEFVPRASRSYRDLPEEARINMEYLTEVMVRNGFIPINSEWWHFNDEEIDRYPLLDISFEEFAGEYLRLPPIS